MPVSGLPHLLEHTCFLLERSPGVIPQATCLLQPGSCLQTVTLESPGESQPTPLHPTSPRLCGFTVLSCASPPSTGRSWPVSLFGICSARNGSSSRTQDLRGSLLGPRPLACGRCPRKAFGTSLSRGQGDGCRMVGSTQGSQEGQSFPWFCEKQHFQEPLQGSKKR